MFYSYRSVQIAWAKAGDDMFGRISDQAGQPAGFPKVVHTNGGAGSLVCAGWNEHLLSSRFT